MNTYNTHCIYMHYIFIYIIYTLYIFIYYIPYYMYNIYIICILCAQLCLTLHSLMDCSLPGSSVLLLCHFPLRGIFLTQGLKWFLRSPALVGRFFTTNATWEAPYIYYIHYSVYIYYIHYVFSNNSDVEI